MSNLVLVGKGPSAVYAKEFEKWGDVAVVNDAAFHVKGPIKFVAVHDFVMAERAKPSFERSELVVVPQRFYAHKLNPVRRLVPAHKAWCSADGHFTCMTALIAARQLSYKRIWLFGFDGGTSYAPGLGPMKNGPMGLKENDQKRRAMVEMLASDEFEGIDAWLWPAHPPRDDVIGELTQGDGNEGGNSGETGEH